MNLLLLLAGCPLGTSDDTGKPGDTGVPFGWSDADTTCDGRWDEASFPGFDAGDACGWGFLWATNATEGVQLRLSLPDADFGAGTDVTYDLSVGADAELTVLVYGAGTDVLDFWTCSDYTEGFTGHVAEGIAGTVHVEARYLCELPPDDFCEDVDHEYHAVIDLSGVTLRASDGSERAWPDVTLRTRLGVDECGG